MASRVLLSRSIFLATKQGSLSLSSSSSFLRLRPISAVAVHLRRHSTAPPPASSRSFSTRKTTSSLSDPSPNWSNRPPKETILLDGCDFEHWLVVMEPPKGENITRDEIIASYIKTLAQVVGSEEEARMKIYSVSTKHYFAFGALVSEELSYKLKELEDVRWVLPDSYLDVRNKDYGGEPFINGEAVPYDPKYHAEWVRNNARANERNRRNDRPRNNDRTRNFERRDNMQNQSRGPPPNMGPASPPNMGPPPPNNMGRSPPMGPRASNMGPNMGPNNMGPNNMGPNMGPNNMGPNNMGPNNMGPNNMGPNNMGPNNMGPNNMGPNNMGPNNMGQVPQNMGYAANNMGGVPPNNMGPNNMGQVPQNMGYVANNMGGVPSNGSNNQYRGGPNNGGPQFQNPPQYQNNDMRGPPQQSNEYLRNFEPNAPAAGNNAYSPQNSQGRDIPPNYQ